MICIQSLKIAAAVSVIIPAVTLWLWEGHFWTLLLFVVWVAAAAYWIVKLDRNEQAKKLESITRHLQETSIQTLNHHRHDWMNDLQVLYGYIRMNKPDKVTHFVDRIRERMSGESANSKLGDPALVFYIQSLRTIASAFHARVSVEGEVNVAHLSAGGQQLSRVLIGLIELYREEAEAIKTDLVELQVMIRKHGEALEVEFTYDGEADMTRQTMEKINNLIAESPLRRTDSDMTMKNVKCMVEFSKG
ncbi:Spo0B domain-containing protein [Paenibacillus sp. GCM10012307]|uniref:Spo0B domain-containing protein n=1 Tax=Paenibacillus roseus TaxID=2798579 RepID=A0A934MW99_9BACL|nr:Spo0B domain-containing protein [Paenibacillus roseus]MBJ6362937.1 Spo0B domain-containing protein [Paenibacillus roseus]